MAMFKGLLGGAAGAAAYTAYRDADSLFSSKDVASGLYEAWQKKGQSNLAEVSRLQRNLDDAHAALLKTLHHQQQPTVIVAGGGGKSGLNTAAGLVLVVGGVALYFRIVKGWKLSDLMYVTRASLSNLSDSMKQSMDTVRSQLEARAADLMERMHVLGGKQEELLEAQGQLGDDLAVVGGKVSAVSDQVSFSNHAILLLCGALSEMAKRVGISNGKYVRELEQLSRSVATTGLPMAMTAAALPMGLPSPDPFQSGPALLSPQAAVQTSSSGRPNPAIFTLSRGAVTPDAAAAASSGLGGAGGAAGSRWLGEEHGDGSNEANTAAAAAAAAPRRPAAKPASWFH